MKKIKKADVAKKISIIGVCAVGLALVISGAVMLSNHTNEILQRSKTQAEIQSVEALNDVESKLSRYISYAATTAGEFTNAGTKAEVKTILTSVKNKAEPGFATARYISNGELCWDLPDNPAIENDLAIQYINSEGYDPQTARYLGVQKDSMPEYGHEYPVDYFEFYCPVSGNGNIDGVCLYYNTNVVIDHINKDFRNEGSLISSLIRDTGNILIGGEGIGFSVQEGLNNFGIYDTATVDSVNAAVGARQTKTILTKINGINHVISIKFSPTSNDLGIFEIYECGALAKETNDLINTIVAILVVFIIIIVGTITFLTVNHYRMQRKINNAEKHDLALDCLNRFGFAKEADEVLARNKDGYYAVVVLHLRHFKFLKENFGKGEISSLEKYIKLTCTKTCKIEEIYGHTDTDDFLMLLHASNREDLIDRLKIHSFLASQYKGANKFDVAIKYGIYERQVGEHTPADKMIEYAYEANTTVTKATVENVDMQFNFYDDNLRKIRLINEDMELRQETALKNGEFQVFYQAKYNLQSHKQDGAEALVRWYDPNTGEYNKPALFMALFESNGFIEKLDKYVYTKVCEYISYSLQQGRKVFPVSVNVSRITATQPDFVDYYTRIKKKYGISNGALTIEFTESFAYENYDVLKTIVDRLHKAGFKTSIDDFGCGYSSYRILKELPMDEIKLDKFFIDYSENPDRINSIFESVIALAKKLNMKVTQEGVERPEDVELLKKLGCDVIQGYIYSHPLSLTDYLHFVENTKDHNL